ncbi:DNA polymerase Y family protein [Lysobacter sp. TY2-98]|uniref:Y-family DNA polymerase n=1 Tax=Lysobacter sp. TY2-98 TaxID=2290922 RepID=UPI000E1FF1C5|nr:DNA polymerase Y family protein [Lysobacter sp. TY2-98]AXK72731.1 DNA polymerase Y family protein [Lysobacter sp. TY2-98]
MDWACLFLPQLALDAVLRDVEDADAPMALLDGAPNARVLHSVSPSARASGLRPGMKLAAAQALGVPCRFVVLDIATVERTRERIAAWAYGFSSQVSLDLSHAIVLEVRRSRRLFGEWPRFEARLREGLNAQRIRHRIVAAPNPHAARVLANVHDSLAVDERSLDRALGDVPIARAGLPPDMAQAFSRMGLRKLGQVLALPRASLNKRFPPTLLRHLDRLRGGAGPLTMYQPPDRFEVRMEFEAEIESSLALLFPLRRLTADLAAFLVSRDDGVQRFSLWMEHEFLPPSEVRVGLLAPERDAAMLFELARGRVEQAALPAPVRAIRLEARELPRFVPAARDLFDTRAQQGMPWTQLRERLRARLGDAAVHDVAWNADHRPERVADNAIVAMPREAPMLARPGWLVSTPHTLREPIARLVTGPERIESGWWDGGDVRRDYYVVETVHGQRAWVYRPLRRFGDPVPPFVLHGWFA